MDKTSLGDRMKHYEQSFNLVFPARFPLLLRLDGVHFSSNVKKWNSKKPFDERLTHAMQQTAKGLADAISGTCIVYSQSDEITMLIRDDMTNNTQPWHGKEQNKILSISAAKATKLFNYHFFKDEVDVDLSEHAEFDCRAYILPEQEIINAFIWRQQDCTKNSVQMLARTLYSSRELYGKNGSEMQDMMMLDHGVNWNDCPTAFKRGFTVYKKDVPVMVDQRDDKHKIIEGEQVEILRSKWVIDLETPIITKDPGFINRFAKLAE